MFGPLISVMQSRTFEQNIPAIYAIMHYDIVRDDGTGEITKTSAKNTKYLNDIFKLSREYGNDQLHTSAKYFIDHLDTSKLINFETSLPEFRAYIDARNFGSGGRNAHHLDMLNRINPDQINASTLATILQNMQIGKPAPRDTTDAKTQAEKNANILPAYYTKVRNALLTLAQKQEIHDRNNHGAIKTLSQRYKELCAKLLNAKSWDAINEYAKNGILNDGYLIALQRDVINGDAEKLTPAEIQMVLSRDSHGFYVRKISDKALRDSQIRLTPNQRAIVAARDTTNTNYALDSGALSLKEKRAHVAKIADEVRAEEPQRKNLAEELVARDNADKQLQEISKHATAVEKAVRAIESMQRAYKDITKNFKDGKPNEKEAYLVDQIENDIYNYISGQSAKAVDIPDWGGLPLFGRGTEKDRRENIRFEINNLNIILATIRGNIEATPDMLNILSKYKNNLLKPETLSDIYPILNGALNENMNMASRIQRQHRTREAITSDQRRLDEHNKQLSYATEKIAAQEERMRDLSKRHLGHNQTGKLVPITDDMTPEEKRATRAKNSVTLQDKLAARKHKKPAKNLAELLANGDIDR